MTATGPLFEMQGLTVRPPDALGASEPFVDGVTFAVGRGETVALVGESGSGKSMSMLAVMRLLPAGFRATAESMTLAGTSLRNASADEMKRIRGARIALIPQNPMSALNPVIRVGHQIAQVVRRHRGVSRAEAWFQAVALIGSVGISEPERRARQYPSEMSGGMLQRVMIGAALSCDPELIIADEPTTALDASLQAQVMELLKSRQTSGGMGLVLISHDLGVVASVSDSVNVMYAGRIVEQGSARDVFEDPQHPYTQALLTIARQLRLPGKRSLHAIAGQPPTLGFLPAGCAFAARCPIAVDRCRRDVPELRDLGAGHRVACHLAPHASTGGVASG